MISVLAFALFLSSFSHLYAEEFAHSQQLYKKYLVEWNYDDEAITMKITADTISWVGFGISPKGTMAGADIIMGGVKNGESYLLDAHAEKIGPPVVDDLQNVMLMDASQVDGKTSLTIRRKLKTGDETDDRDITAGNVTVIWAYGFRDLDEVPEYIDYHWWRKGSSTINFLKDRKAEQTTTSELTTTPLATTSSAAPATETSVQPSTTTTPPTTASTEQSTTTESTTTSATKAPPTKPVTTETPPETFQSTTTPKVTTTSAAGTSPAKEIGGSRAFGKDGRVKFTWRINDNKIIIGVTAPTPGWIGIGFSSGPTMAGADLIIAGSRSRNRGYILDSHALQNGVPSSDSLQDVKLLVSTQTGFATTVMFERNLTASEPNDFSIMPGEDIYVLWAYGARDIRRDPNRGNYHGRNNRGAVKIQLIPSPTI
uniref:uncharacterized protein LOC120338136 n=1 Tax=Styela clava TaxID=7725 RepID=UPI00193AD595|nr:uncharacterized protein LOC120338136 [Styela clava]